jgi:hypothetical protein
MRHTRAASGEGGALALRVEPVRSIPRAWSTEKPVSADV